MLNGMTRKLNRLKFTIALNIIYARKTKSPNIWNYFLNMARKSKSPNI